MRKFLLLTLICLLLIPAGQSMAQEDTPAPADNTLQYGAAVAGSITPEQLTQIWRLENVTADRIDVRVERTDGTLIPDITLLDASGQFITTSYGADETGAVALIDSFELPAAGTYQIMVGRQDGQAGATQGSYQLVVMPRGTAPTATSNQQIYGEVTYGAPLEGAITAESWQHLYTLTTDAPDWIEVMVARVDGTLFPEYRVLNAAGDELFRGYTEDDGTLSLSDNVLPEAGTYTVVVLREEGQDGDTTGTYQLLVTLRGAGEGSASLNTPAATISYDTPATGTISGAQWYQDYTFTTDSTDVLALEVQRTDGSLVPELSLQDSEGNEIQHGWSESTGDIARMYAPLNAPGTYTVRVLRYGGQMGGTTGDFELNVNLLGVGEDSPALAPAEGAVITSEKPVTGSITNARWLDSWTFEAQPDQPYDLIADRTDGTFIPMLFIYDSEGNEIYSTYPDETYAVARIEDYYFPSGGSYRIVVGRMDGVRGLTSGSYTLTIKPGTAE